MYFCKRRMNFINKCNLYSDRKILTNNLFIEYYFYEIQFFVRLVEIQEWFNLAVDRELLKEVTQELWNTVKKLRPEIDRQTRLQLVLKALLTIGDLPDQMQAAMVVGVCAEMDKSDGDNVETNSQTKDSSGVDTSTGRKVVRRSSAK